MTCWDCSECGPEIMSTRDDNSHGCNLSGPDILLGPRLIISLGKNSLVTCTGAAFDT